MNPSPSPCPEPAAFSRKLAARLEAIAPLTDELSEWAEAAGAPVGVTSRMALMLDELITNIVTHGYPPGVTGEVELHAEVHDAALDVRLRDWGVAFNPLELPEPDTSLSLEERAIGGLGVHFVRRMADELSYQRVGEGAEGRNELRIVKRFATA